MKTIAIDFDGVIHKYSKGWQDGSIYDEPFDGVFESIKTLMDEGYSVFIFSTRSPSQIKSWIKAEITDWNCVFVDFPCDTWKYGYNVQVIPFWTKFWNKRYTLGITQRKLPAVVYVDDRALKFEGDWKKTITALTK